MISPSVATLLGDNSRELDGHLEAAPNNSAHYSRNLSGASMSSCSTRTTSTSDSNN